MITNTMGQHGEIMKCWQYLTSKTFVFSVF